MDWKEYFEKTSGMGFLATANKEGEVDIAVYSKPKVMEDGTWAYGMADRLTHANLQVNPHAIYAFNEKEFQGVRLFLEKEREETEGPMLDDYRQDADRLCGPGHGDAVKYVAYFRVKKHLPLVGE